MNHTCGTRRKPETCDSSPLEDALEGGADSEPVISSFYAKTWLAHALGLIGTTVVQDLMEFKDIRNTFAHSAAPVTFDWPPLAESCQFNVLAKIDFSGRDDKPKTPKENFVFTYRLICGALNSIANPIEPQPPPSPFSAEVTKDMADSARRILS